MSKRAISVKITGWILVIIGLISFFSGTASSYLLMTDKQSFVRFITFVGSAHRLTGGSTEFLPQAAETGFEGARIVFSDHPFVYALWSILLPAVAFIILLGGVGILRGKMVWKKVLMATVPVWAATRFVIDIFMYSYFFLFLTMGKIIDPNLAGTQAVAAGKVLKLLPVMLTRKFVHEALIVCLLILLLLNPRLREAE